MAAEIPSRVLSDQLRAILRGRRVVAAVFMTYNLEPAFFEEEVVTLLADDSLVQEAKIRLIQLEEALRGEIGPIGVYFDPRGLCLDGSKRLDIRYVPVRVPTGLFHPKLVLILTQPRDSDGDTGASLVCGVLSANLTKNAWWRSVECAHFEVVSEGETCGFRDDLLTFLRDVRRFGGQAADHEALDQIRTWLGSSTWQSLHATQDGRLRTRLVAGRASLLEFLEDARGAELRGSSLEVISPFLDESRPSALSALIEKFQIREARVFLPSQDDGSALVGEALFDGVRKLPACKWARLPHDLLKLGKDKNTKLRGVHAKVYRFFRKSDRYEAILVGSHNLTAPAHNRGGNVEASFFIEREAPGSFEWWLAADSTKPRQFAAPNAEEEPGDDGYMPLALSFNWTSNEAVAMWHGGHDSGTLTIDSAGSVQLEIENLEPGESRSLSADLTARLEAAVLKAAVLTVTREDGRSGPVLVQEYGMSRKPSIIRSWSVSDVLEYWARLTPALKAAFLAERAGNVPGGLADDLDRPGKLQRLDSFFTTFAGVFHGFEMLRRQAYECLAEKRTRQADYLLFGRRHDSLPSVIRMAGEQGEDHLRAYLLLLCARQLLRELKRESDDFLIEKRPDINTLLAQTGCSREVRGRLDVGADGEAFLDWFERHFVPRLETHAEAVDA